MVKTLMTTTPATGLSRVATTHSACTAPFAAAQGTGLPFAGTSAALAVVAVSADVRTIALPGSHPRGAPV